MNFEGHDEEDLQISYRTIISRKWCTGFETIIFLILVHPWIQKQEHLVEHSHSTIFRQNFIKVPKMNNTIGQRFFINLGPWVISELPKPAKDICKIRRLKRFVKEYLLIAIWTSIMILIDLKNWWQLYWELNRKCRIYYGYRVY